MIRKLLIILFFIPLLSISQNTYDNIGRVTSDQTFDNDGKLIITRNYFYNKNNLTHELWFNNKDKLLVRYNYNQFGDVSEIIKYSPWVENEEITDRESYYYDNRNLIFSIYSDMQSITEKIYNSRGDEIYIIHHNKSITIQDLLSKRRTKTSYIQNKGYKAHYYSNNTLKEEGFYENSLKEGFWVYYYKNGEVKKEGVYYMGKKNEIWIEYNIRGEISRESKWYDGILKNEVCFDKNNIKIRCK